MYSVIYPNTSIQIHHYTIIPLHVIIYKVISTVTNITVNKFMEKIGTLVQSRLVSYGTLCPSSMIAHRRSGSSNLPQCLS